MKTKGKQNTVNMTEGNPVRLILLFSIPMLIGNIFQQFYNFADSVIVGQFVGADALAAIGATGSITFFFFALCNGIGSAGGIITSQFFGEGSEDKVKNCIANTAYIMLLVPTAIGIIAFFAAGPILELLRTPESIMQESKVYMRIMCVNLVLVSAYNYASSMLRALGDSKTPLYFLIFSCILNIVLDIIFVYNLHLGVFGAGIATLIASFICGVLCLAFAFKTNPYFKMSKSDWKVNPVLLKKCIKLGVPLSLQFSLIAISCMALQRVVNAFGPVAVAAFTATSRIEQLIHQPYGTLGTALATYCGQNYGAKKQGPHSGRLQKKLCNDGSLYGRHAAFDSDFRKPNRLSFCKGSGGHRNGSQGPEDYKPLLHIPGNNLCCPRCPERNRRRDICPDKRRYRSCRSLCGSGSAHNRSLYRSVGHLVVCRHSLVPERAYGMASLHLDEK